MKQFLIPALLAAAMVTPLTAQEPPAARRAATEDTLHGERVPDPYRWMEDLESPETRRWALAQDSFARQWVAGAERERWRARIAQLATVKPLSPPVERAGLLFYQRYNTTGGTADVTLFSTRRGLADARELTLSSDPTRNPVRTMYPAQRAPLIVYALGVDASSWRSWGVYDGRSNRTLRDTLYDVHAASSPAWLAGDRAFYYPRYRQPPADSLRTARLSSVGLFLHRVGTRQADDSLVYRPADPSCTLSPYTAETGSTVVIQEACAAGDNSLIAITNGRTLRLATGAEQSYRFAGSMGDTMYWQTNEAAPNHKVVSLRIVDGVAQWRTVVPESSLPLFSWGGSPLGANLVGRTLLLAYQKDAIAEITAYDIDSGATRRIELPEVGSIWSGFVGDAHSDHAYYSVSGVASPARVYRLDVRSGRSTLWAQTQIDLPVDSIITEQVFVTSPDGTRFPMFVVRRRDVPLDGTAAAWIYGYGFGDWSASPWFQPNMAEFINRGGVWALPNIRGGAEYGEAWSAEGSREKKQNSITDFIAASRYLVEHGYTSERRIVANGSSAGGIVAAAAAVQRPELYGALVLDYPALDMLRYHLFTVGSTWLQEYGTIQDESQFRALRRISAPHTLVPGTCYPPVLVSPGELDAVTPPFHAYKFVAEMQHAKGCRTHPALLRVSWGAGHSSGRTLPDRIDTWADQLAFIDKVLKPTRHISLKTLPEIEKRGTGRTTLLMIPCASCRWKSFEPFMTRNDSLYTMYAVTLPGYGGARLPLLPLNSDSTPWRDNAVAALSRLLDTEDLDNVIVLGHSQGASIAIQLANARRDRVAAVVNLDGGISSAPQYDALTHPELVELARGALLQYAENLLFDADYWQSFNSPAIADPARAQLHHGWFMATPRDVVMQYWREGIIRNLNRELRALQQPLLDIKAIRPRVTNVDSAHAAYDASMRPVVQGLRYERVFLDRTPHYLLETDIADAIIARFARR